MKSITFKSLCALFFATMIGTLIGCATKEYSLHTPFAARSVSTPSVSSTAPTVQPAVPKAQPVVSKAQPAAPKVQSSTPLEQIDYQGFFHLTGEVGRIRTSRLLKEKDFVTMMQKEGTMVLDTRSKKAYDGLHIKGAVHLNFSDFTEEKLAQVIPSKTTTVLIYCNNNFDNDPINFARKMPPLALNIPTFINLYGYGYENLYELQTPFLIDPKNSLLEFEGTYLADNTEIEGIETSESPGKE